MASDSGLDRYLAAHLGAMSPRELSEITGVPENEVVSRAQAYYDSTTLSAGQQFAQMVMQLRELANEGIQRARNASDRDSSAHITAASNTLAKLDRLIADQAKRDREDSAERDALTSRMLIRLIEASFQRTLGELQARFPEELHAEVEASFKRNLLAVAADYDSAT